MELRIVTNKVLAVNLLILGSVAGVCSGVSFLVALDIGSIFSFVAAFTALIIGILTITENDRLVWMAMVLAYGYEAVCLLHTLVFLGIVIGACNSSLYLTTEKGGCSRSKEFTGIYAFNMALTLTNGVLCALLILNVCGCFNKRTEKARPMSRPVTKTKQRPRSQPQPQTQTRTRTKKQTHTQQQTETKTLTQTPTQTETETKTKTLTQTPTQTQTETETKTKTQTPHKTVPAPTETAVPDTKNKRTKKSKRPSSIYNWPSTPILSPSPGR
ncbi:uncharacterized protein LOC118420181 [Branchiostoma floridae]|uniref:Uncharacterized protein LOC118420181 n=1 Tax=Branchiostoma floridae TaxID=7739 RepID=A0A9J7LIC9_BRAFL|nr:uncharacterized protein LOC118420181 [Branchiostoma floridae]